MSKLRETFDVTLMELNDKTQDPTKYSETLKKLCTLEKTSHLSYLLHHLQSFAEAKPFNINIFRKGITASWEDENNVLGCSWSIQCRPEYSNAIFERLAIYFATEDFNKFTCNGISANIRKNFVKFTVWSKSIPTVTDGQDVLEELNSVFGFCDPAEFIYKNHKDLVERVVSSNEQSPK